LQDFLTAAGLLLVFEGILFAAFPEATKRAMMQVIGSPDQWLRRTGILCAIGGVVLIWFARHVF
jgi:uncharacterized protein